MIAVGVDGAKGGWLAVVVGERGVVDARLVPSLAGVLTAAAMDDLLRVAAPVVRGWGAPA